MKLLAIIPARGGSKGLPGKNLRLLNGKPLIQYTIDAAKSCEVIDRLFLSSDDDEIIRFCVSLGLEVPYKRPSHLAGDESPMLQVVHDALDYLEKREHFVPEAILLLQPTSPLRNARHIAESVRLFEESGADTLTSVHTVKEHPYECAKLLTDGGWRYLDYPRSAVSRRQDYACEYVFINGAIYIVKTKHLLDGGGFLSEGETVFYHMAAEYGVDIDDYMDMRYAEFLMR